MKRVLQELRNDGIMEVQATYLPTTKNAQVKDFYEKCGFNCLSEIADGSKQYVLELKDADLEIEKYYHINLK
jgi:predicted enzyme involved in methoxymalonyl-ACP biosynthesis